jgi:hypothetical protein
MAKKKVDLSDPVQREAYWTGVASAGKSSPSGI